MSVWPVAIQTRLPDGIGIIGAPEPAAPAQSNRIDAGVNDDTTIFADDNHHSPTRRRGVHRRRRLSSSDNHHGHETGLLCCRAGWLRAKRAPPRHQQ
jgi:hypothetical protein